MNYKTKKNSVIATEIIESVADSEEIDPFSMMVRSRKWKYSYPRLAAMFLIRKYTTLSLGDIGKIFKLNHANVCYANRKISAAGPDDRISIVLIRAEKEFLQRQNKKENEPE